MDRTLVVGQAPSRDTDGRAPFSGRSGRKLAELLGIPHERLGEVFRLENLLDRFPGKAGKGDRFPAKEAREGARRLSPMGQPALLVGKAVAAAFGLRNAPFFEWLDHDGGKVAVVPHPSGVNRWWNDPENRRRARAFLRQLAP